MKRLLTVFAAITLVIAGQSAWAVSKQAQIVQDSTQILNNFVNIPDNYIPPKLLRKAYAIAIVPSVLKAGFVVGGRYGKGILSVRTGNGSWSHPVFIKLGGASLGWQIGASSTDIILVFKTQRGVDRILNGEVTLGGDVSVAAGPVGRSASAATNLRLNAEIYSYSRSRGLFAGIALQGGVISIDEDDTWRYYDSRIAMPDVLHDANMDTLPATGKRLVYTLNQYMPAVNGSRGPVPFGEAGGQSGNGPARDYERDPARAYYQGEPPTRSDQGYYNTHVRTYDGQAGNQAQNRDQYGANTSAQQPDQRGDWAQAGNAGNAGNTGNASNGQAQAYDNGQVQPYQGAQVQPYTNGNVQSYSDLPGVQTAPQRAGDTSGQGQEQGNAPAAAGSNNYGPVYE